MSNYEWFLLIVVVIVVPLIVAVVVTLWTIDQANKRKRANRADSRIGVKRKAALSPDEVEARRAARANRQSTDTGVMTSLISTSDDRNPDGEHASDVSRETSPVTIDATPSPSSGNGSSDSGYSGSDSGSGDSGGGDSGGGDS